MQYKEGSDVLVAPDHWQQKNICLLDERALTLFIEYRQLKDGMN
jgi:hypothetical protein